MVMKDDVIAYLSRERDKHFDNPELVALFTRYINTLGGNMKSATISTAKYEEEVRKIKMKVDTINYATESTKEKFKMMLDEMSENLIKEEMQIWECLK